MAQIIAYCGINCQECDAYQATQSGDEAAKERVAAGWRQTFQEPKIDANYISCDGCTSQTGRICGYCGACAVRSCAIEHKVENCAHCSDYACELLDSYFERAPELRETLDAIRQAL